MDNCYIKIEGNWWVGRWVCVCCGWWLEKLLGVVLAFGDQFISFVQYFPFIGSCYVHSFQVAKCAHFQRFEVTVGIFENFPTYIVFNVLLVQFPQVICQLGALEWLGLIGFREGVFVLIKSDFKRPACRSNVCLRGAICRGDLSFINYIFGKAFVIDRTIGFASAIAWGCAGCGFIQNFFIVAVDQGFDIGGGRI